MQHRDSRDAREVVGNLDRPSQSLGGPAQRHILTRAEFNNEMAARSKRTRGGLEQRSQNRQARLAGKERRLRFEARDFRLECRRVSAIDIGRIGDDQIHGTGNGVEQIAANRVNPRSELVARDVAGGYPERLC